jgi:hypothetical protein
LVEEESSLDAGDDGQYDRKNGDYTGPDREPPFIRRFIEAITLVSCAGYAGWRAGDSFYNERGLVGAAWIVIGLTIGGGGMGLFLLNGFPSTWGWIL